MDSTSLLTLATQYWPEYVRTFKRRKVLYWQGDPVTSLFIIQQGVVKISSVSSDGKIYSQGILGVGHLLGATDYFLDGIHESTAETIDNTTLVAIPLKDFQQAIASNPQFSTLVMQELAKKSRTHLDKAHDLSFLDTQQRLKHTLIQLASEHGLSTPTGVEIGVNITHEDIGELINANRTTITRCLNELKKLGYLRTEGRRIVLIPIRHMEILDLLSQSIISGTVGEAADLVQLAIAEHIDPHKTLQALATGMKEVDRQYERGHMEIADVSWSASHMQAALPIIEEAMQQENIQPSHLGKIVFGTVWGDVHDIGKNITSMLLKARGFEVIDLGVNVPPEQFVSAIHQHQPDVLAMSALLTTTTLEMKTVLNAIQQAGLRDQVKVMVGGTPLTPRFAQEIGADGYAHEARDGVELAWGWCVNPE